MDILDFSVEHLSWLERRTGLRYMTGPIKEGLHAELLEHMRTREKGAREAALEKQRLRESVAYSSASQQRQRRSLLAGRNSRFGEGWDGNSKGRGDVSGFGDVDVVAVFPYFATNSHCHETGAANAKAAKGGALDSTGARCDSGSSDPMMRRYFLNLTFWTVS